MFEIALFPLVPNPEDTVALELLTVEGACLPSRRSSSKAEIRLSIPHPKNHDHQCSARRSQHNTQENDQVWRQQVREAFPFGFLFRFAVIHRKT